MIILVKTKSYHHFLILTIILTAALFYSCTEDEPIAFQFNFPEDCCVNSAFEFSGDFTGCSSDSGIRTYVPCVFSPDSEIPQNRMFNFFTTGTFDRVETEIRSQDGVVVYQDGNFLPSLFNYGWDGRMNNQLVDGPFKVSYTLFCNDEHTGSFQGIVLGTRLESNSSCTISSVTL